MSFKLSVDFTGLLHYIRNTEEPKDVRLCIVMPVADNHNALILRENGTVLQRQGQPVTEPVNFDRKRVVFLLEKEASAQVPAAFNFAPAVLDGEVKGAVPIEDLIGNLADQNPRVVSEGATERDGVRAQILIEEGEFSLPGANNPAQLELRRDPLGPATTLALSPIVRMEVDGLRSAKMVVLPLGNLNLAEAAVYTIEPGNQVAEVRITHLCPFVLNGQVREEDEDFRFHYGLLAQEQFLRPGQPLGINPINSLPVPRITQLPREDQPGLPFRLLRIAQTALAAATGSGLDQKSGKQGLRPYGLSGSTCNCASCDGVPRPYNLDTFSQRNLAEQL